MRRAAAKSISTYEHRSGQLQFNSPFWNWREMPYLQSSVGNITQCSFIKISTTPIIFMQTKIHYNSLQINSNILLTNTIWCYRGMTIWEKAIFKMTTFLSFNRLLQLCSFLEEWSWYIKQKRIRLIDNRDDILWPCAVNMLEPTSRDEKNNIVTRHFLKFCSLYPKWRFSTCN